MVIIGLRGGLGNQMFQYALGRRIALENNSVLKLDISSFKNDYVYKRKYSLGCFNIIENIATEKDLKKATTLKSKNYIGKFIRLITKMKPYYKRYLLCEQQLFKYDPNVLRKFRDVYIDGSWQNEKYFKNIEDILRNEFAFKTNLDGENLKLAEQIRNTNSVSLHMRNYALNCSVTAISNRDLNEYGIMSSDYYNKAVKYIEKTQNNLQFFVFSDDINLARRNIKLEYPTSFIVTNDGKDYENLQLMSLCKHQIISNSTFSWWAGWLNNNPDKIIIGPKKWFVDAHYDTSDLVPKDWIKI